MPKVLVTGSKGFIGSYFIPYLKDQGYNVLGIDIQQEDEDGYQRANITSFEDVQELFNWHDIGIVVHMAGEVGRINGEERPHHMIYTNEMGTLNLVKACLKHRAKLVYFSTSEVYGTSFDGQIMDEMAPIQALGTTNIYAMTKLFGEAIVKHYVENYGLKAVTLRPFMIYGPWEHATRYRSALINFIRAASENRPLTVHRDTERAWCHVRDFIKGAELVMRNATYSGYEVYNVGSEEYHSMEEVAQMVISRVGKGSIELVDPPDRFLTLKKRFSIDKAKLLGYSPQITLAQGIDEILESMRVAAI